VALHPSTVLDSKPPWVVFQEFVLTSRNFVRTVTAARVDWLVEQAPHYFDLETWPEGETKQELERANQQLNSSLPRHITMGLATVERIVEERQLEPANLSFVLMRQTN
jgi:pre-mRNA-splicing factor ATP-dependent RNA helicase DHX15/PRP43